MTNDKLADEIERYLAPDAIYHHWEPSMEDMKQIIAALRAERPQSGEMVMVPREPTEEMIRIAKLSLDSNTATIAAVYRQILAAAQEGKS